MTAEVWQGDRARDSEIFEEVSSALGQGDIGAILYNWNESSLSADSGEIIKYPGRDGRFTKGEEGGAVIIGKGEFLAWLQSSSPFSADVYGADIANDAEWAELIHRARAAADAATIAGSNKAGADK